MVAYRRNRGSSGPEFGFEEAVPLVDGGELARQGQIGTRKVPGLPVRFARKPATSTFHQNRCMETRLVGFGKVHGPVHWLPYEPCCRARNLS